MVAFTWDEPEGATSPRGWASFEGGHPDDCDRWRVESVCGWYLDYTGCSSHGPDGAPILASAYMFRTNHLGISGTDRLGSSWFWTAAAAKEWIERAVSLHLEGLTVGV